MKPLAIDLFCGLGGWTEGLLAEGWDVIGFDIERHVYGEQKYPAQLVIQDVRTLHGSQFRNADLIVASPPCQFFSRMAMPFKCPWGQVEFERRRDLALRLFWICFSIQQEACVAAGHHIPLIVENVRGTQKWVGPAHWSFGSFLLWGDIPALMPMTRSIKNAGGSWFAIGPPGQKVTGQNPDGRKVPGMNFHEFAKTGKPGRSFQSAAVEGMKVPSESGRRTDKGKGARFTSRDCGIEGVKQRGSGPAGFDNGLCKYSSKSSARKAASAQIAKIPDPLSRHIARVFFPNIPSRLFS